MQYFLLIHWKLLYHYIFSNVVDRARAVGTKTSIEGADMGKEVINVTKKVRGDMALVTEKGVILNPTEEKICCLLAK